MQTLSMYREAASILMEGTNDSLYDVMAVLEDAESPINKKYREKLYQNIIDRKHVDFGDIPKSKGDITKYSGYETMKETLDVLIALGRDEKCNDLIKYSTVVVTAIENIKKLKNVYMKAYSRKNEYVTLDYQLYVYTCVEATTSLIGAFVNDIKTPSSEMKIVLKDTRFRGNLFFIQSLMQFNRVNENNKYSSFLMATLANGQENLLGEIFAGASISSLALGTGAIALIALSIIPVTRKLIYYYKELKRKLSETLSTQAYFLEMNKACIEYNSTIDPKKKKKILQKQEKMRKVFLSLSDRLKVTDTWAERESGKKIQNDNKTMSMDNIRDEVSDSDIVIM